MKTFVLNGDDFEEANEARDVGYSGGSQWRNLPHFTEEVLKRISVATYAAMFAFTETLQRHRRTSLCSCNISPTVTRHRSPIN